MKILLFLLSFLIVFCSEHTTEPPIQDDIVFEISEFPNTTGTEWTYAYYDSLSSTADTVKVIVHAQQNGFRLWQYIYRDKIDSLYVQIEKDTVNIFNSYFSSTYPAAVFVFPIEEGSSWDGKMFTHKSEVIGRDTVITDAGEFTNAWLVREQWGALNDYGYINTWLVPNVGIVKKYHFGWSFGTANNTWELLEYAPPDKAFN